LNTLAVGLWSADALARGGEGARPGGRGAAPARGRVQACDAAHAWPVVELRRSGI